MQEERIAFNDYMDTRKRLKFDNVSGSSLILSKSAESSSAIGTTQSRKQTQQIHSGNNTNSNRNRLNFTGGSSVQTGTNLVRNDVGMITEGGFYQATLRALQGVASSLSTTNHQQRTG